MPNRLTRWVGPLVLAALLGSPLASVHASPARAEPVPVALLPWDDLAGRVLGREAASEGPKAFAVTPWGGAFVLDQVHLRVIELDSAGQVASTIPLPADTFDDLELAGGWALLALDRVGGKALLVMDLEGNPVAEVRLEGRGIQNAGLVTALLPRDDGVWLEVQHRYSVKVLDRDLMPCERQVVYGRPIPGGRSLIGALDRRGGVTLRIAPRNARLTAPGASLTSASPIRRIAFLDADARGDVHVVLHQAVFDAAPPYRVLHERYDLVRLDGELREVARWESPWVLSGLDQSVEFRVDDAGRLWQMAFRPEGVSLVRWEGGAP